MERNLQRNVPINHLTRQCPVTSWHCVACPWQRQASHTPLYRLPLTLRKPEIHA